MKDCINPVAYWQCISLNSGKCLYGGPCEPIDQEGNRYTMVAIRDGERTDHQNIAPSHSKNSLIDSETTHAAISLIKDTRALKHAPIIDNDQLNESLVMVRRLKARTTCLVITEEPVPGYSKPSPHPFLDPAARRYNRIQMICDACPACSNCTNAKERTAPDFCDKLRRALA
ncbi:MAG: hypothetical protein M0Q91_05070 [Methanoregula sp.]|jgi:hypothetical protein|nr:hypothetical protein [Methanoregula sp.]